MDYEFNSQEELFKRVKPALSSKKSELDKLGYNYIEVMDIWNYLVNNKWKHSRNLMLSDIVNDILNVSNDKLDKFLKEKFTQKERTQYFIEDEEIL
ncbi:MAG: hypothetical protein IJI22_00220 [Bacilli bacterium]|nr:hypothetical protein [Bacilli bacterium]